MGKKSKGGNKAGNAGNPLSSHFEYDPETIRFTHSKIRPFFSGCGRKIQDTITSLMNDEMKIEQLPQITVIIGKDGHIFSLNNRRLYVLKYLRKEGKLKNNLIKVRTKAGNSKELERYTPERCSLNATIMREKAALDDAINTETKLDN